MLVVATQCVDITRLSVFTVIFFLGQKSNYVAPGDATSEIYRLSTFKKFSEDIPIDVPTLAAHGFYYTGYKDRVKCFRYHQYVTKLLYTLQLHF